jgi:hypothetical protein
MYALSLIVVIIRLKPEVLGSVRGASEYRTDQENVNRRQTQSSSQELYAERLRTTQPPQISTVILTWANGFVFERLFDCQSFE